MRVIKGRGKSFRRIWGWAARIELVTGAEPMGAHADDPQCQIREEVRRTHFIDCRCARLVEAAMALLEDSCVECTTVTHPLRG